MNNEYISISQLNNYIKGLIDETPFLNNVFIKGEISNFKAHTRGHYYFTLKDDTSRLNAIMFSSSTKNIKFIPEDGMQVLVSGRISVYEATGNYQIYVNDMIADGIGSLYLKFESLKKELAQKGVFDVNHKLPIPKFPKKIGMITASTGAAIRDILTTIKRRYNLVETILFPTLVQGEGAKESIVNSINKAQNFDLDLIILGRGGGSIEDLWAFNELIVAKAIYDCKIPIISAVGHEIDFTISDYVSDLRAATPTAAAELAVPNIIEIKENIYQTKLNAVKNMNNILNNNKNKLDSLKDSFILKNPMSLYAVKEQKLSNLIDILNNNTKNLLNKNNSKYDLCINKLKLLNPLYILEKGYSVVYNNNKIINNINDLKINDLLDIKLFKGNIKAKIMEVKDERK